MLSMKEYIQRELMTVDLPAGPCPPPIDEEVAPPAEHAYPLFDDHAAADNAAATMD